MDFNTVRIFGRLPETSMFVNKLLNVATDREQASEPVMIIIIQEPGSKDPPPFNTKLIANRFLKICQLTK